MELKKDHELSSSATPYNIQLSASETPGLQHVERLGQESADKVSELLMLNHVRYHTLFNEAGLHNHIVHYLLSLWPLGATPSQIQQMYDNNKTYQFPTRHHSPSVAIRLKDSAFFKECLGKTDFYGDYLTFFQDEIQERGVPDVVNEFLFKGDGKADDLLGRVYSGFLHPIIHLGYGLEFHQPALVAESLAAACIHDDWPLSITLLVEAYIASNPDLPTTSLLSVIQAFKADPVINTAVKPTDGPNLVTDGLMKRAAKEVIQHVAKWRVKPTKEDIEYRLAEMTHICMYLSGAAQNPAKVIMIDFFMMHSTNLSIFFMTFMRLECLSLEAKARLLTWMGWMVAAFYGACGSPTLYPERIHNYRPKNPEGWNNVVARACAYPDDGHTSKLIRALMNAENISGSYIGRPEFPLGKDDFLTIGHMAMDSVERILEPWYRTPEHIRKLYVEKLGMSEEVVKIVARFVRWCGIEGAWDDVADLEKEGDARTKL